MWPKLLDLSREDSKRVLRRIELEAYSGVVSAFRAQGDLTKDKKKILQDLQHILSISTERHRAEVRRAVNDEKLTTVADNLSATTISSEWQIEGRRLIPLMPRLVPQTAFTGLANNAASMQAEKNASMPSPATTGNKDMFQNIAMSTPATTPTASGTKVARPASPTSNVVVLPSGMSIHIKGGLNTEEDEEIRGKKRRRSSSVEGMVALAKTASLPMCSLPKVQYASTASCSNTSSLNTIQGITPMKITFTKSPSRSQTTLTPSQKVIVVSSTASNTQTSSVFQKSISVPIIKSSAMTVTTTTSALMQPKTSILMPQPSSSSSGSLPANGNLGNIITVATSSNPTTPTTPTTTATTLLTSAFNVAKAKAKTITRQRTPPIHMSQKPGVVIPMGPQALHSPSNTTVQGIHIKPISNKPTIQIKQEGGMKIITHAISNAAGKLLPKPAQLGSGGSSNVVVVSNSNSSSIAMAAKSLSSGSSLAGKVLNITTAGGKVIATTTKSTPNVVTVNPKTLQISAVKTSGTSTPLKMSTPLGNKPNVIVVQKAHPKQVLSLTGQGKSASSSPFEKELVSFIQKQDTHRVEKVGGQMINIVPSVVRVEKKIVQKPTVDLMKKVHVRPRSDSDTSGKSSLLAELIHAAGIAPDGSSGANSTPETPTVIEDGGPAGVTLEIPGPQTQGQQLPLNEWVDYDVNPDDQSPAQSQSQQELSAIRALLKVHNSSGPEPTSQPTTLDLSQLSQLQLQQGEFLNIDQAANILKQMSQGESSSSSSSQNYVQYLQNPSQSPQEHTKVVTNTVNNTQAPPEIGELDPQTGLFMPTPGGTKVPDRTVRVEKMDVKKDGKPPMDIFSSAIAEAQIDLDTYQFDMDDEENLRKFQSPQVMEMLNQIEGGTIDPATSQGVVTVLSSGASVVQVPTTQVTTVASSSQAPVTTVSSQSSSQVMTPRPVEGQQGQGDSKQTYITFQEVSQGPNSEVVAIVSRGNVQVIEQPIVARNVAVTVEPSGLDPSLMKMEDFTSQRLDSRQEVDDGGLYSEEGSSSDSQHDGNVRLSKRKRKPPAAIDDSPPPPVTLSGWVRAALSLLQRVSRYRGNRREKGEINAAEWFLQPVDPNDAPGYYNIIKQPMDFRTIKKRLETGQYSGLDEFHHDMILVRDNCHLYNPEEHEVRRDCDDVFNFYLPEYEKMVERLQKEPPDFFVEPNIQLIHHFETVTETGMLSPISKKPRIEAKSPIKLGP